MLIPLGILASAGAGAAAGSYELIESSILLSDTTSVTFSAIPQDYKHLQIRAVVRSDRNNSPFENVLIRFNSDTSSNYSYHQLLGFVGMVDSASSISKTYTDMGIVAGNTGTVNSYGAVVIDILDYASSTKNTTLRSLHGMASTSNERIGLQSGLWINTNAVNTILAFPLTGPNWIAGSRFSLYGIKG